MTDRDGNATTYAYVPAGHPGAGSLQTITDPVGLVTTLAYDAAGHLRSITDPAGRVTTVTVGPADNLTGITDPDGASTAYGYGSGSGPFGHALTSETNPDGHTAVAHYNDFGQLQSETLFDGASTVSLTSAQARGLLAPGDTGPLSLTHGGSVTDPLGHTTSVGFNWMGHPTGMTDPTGAQTQTSYSHRGFPTAVTDALDRTTSYTYDKDGHVTSITEPAAGYGSGSGYGPSTETIAYDDPFGVPTAITDFNGHTTTFTLDDHGNVLRRTDPDGLHEDWTYNAAGQVLTHTDRNGHTTTYAYDLQGRLTTITEPGAGAPAITYAYDDAGNVTSVTDELGHTTRFTYDDANRPTSEADPVQYAAGQAVTFTYDDAGNLLSVTDAMGRVTSYEYDARNRRTSMTDPANQGTGKKTTYAYDAAGNLVSATDPDGHTTGYGYDGRGQLASETLPDIWPQWGFGSGSGSGSGSGYNPGPTDWQYGGQGYGSGPAAWQYRYDDNGNPTAVTDPLGHAATVLYDALNRRTAATDALGDTTGYGYDAAGNVTSVTDPDGDVTTYTYDERDRLTSTTEPAGGGTTSYTYDDAGNLLTLTDPDGNTTTYTYDDANRVLTETSPTGGVTTYTYDLDGEPTQKTDPLGRTIAYAHDADGRLTTETWVNPNGGTPVNVVTTTYDAAGRVTEVQDDFSDYTYTYDAAGRVTSVDNAGTPGAPHVVLTYTYDAAGNRLSMGDNLGGTVGYTYDARNELVQETQTGTGVDPERVDVGYDDAGNRSFLARYADLAGTSRVAITHYTYDDAERLTGITTEDGSDNPLTSYAYTLDPASRLTQEVRYWDGGASDDTITYGYTDNGQLTSVSHTDTSFAGESYSYDANGNRTMTGYSTGTGNELTSDGTYNYTYDADGNLATKTDIAGGVETDYVWDYRNRLTEVDQYVNGVKTVLALYVYDALNNPIKVEEGGSTRWTAYDGNRPVLDFDGSGTLTARYLQGPMVDEVLARDTPTGGAAWYLRDRLGTVRDIIGNNGTVLDHLAYNAYGQLLSQSNASAGDRFVTYAGLQHDDATGLDQSWTRQYGAAIGRWTGPDWSGFGGGDANLYRYVGNAATNAIDPTGLQVKINPSIISQIPIPITDVEQLRQDRVKELTEIMEDMLFAGDSLVDRFGNQVPPSCGPGGAKYEFPNKEWVRYRRALAYAIKRLNEPGGVRVQPWPANSANPTALGFNIFTIFINENEFYGPENIAIGSILHEFLHELEGPGHDALKDLVPLTEPNPNAHDMFYNYLDSCHGPKGENYWKLILKRHNITPKLN